MNALLCKISSFRIWVLTSTGKPCETSGEAFQSPPRSVQVCTCRPHGSSHLKAVSIMSSASPTEEATSRDDASAPSFNPLPLLSSHSAAIPGPLKFLWNFNREEQQATEPRDQDNLDSTGRAGDDKDTFSGQFDGEGHLIKFDVPISKQENHHEAHVLMEPSREAGVDDGKSSLSSETHVTGGGSSVTNNTPASPPLRKWVSKIAALWPDPNYFRTRSAPAHMTSSSEPVDVSSDTDADDTNVKPQLYEGEKGLLACSVEAVDGCALEVPYTKVLHTKESFFEFLQDASLFDMKVFAQLAFLCDLAYTISDIQPGQLMKYHRLKLVISSLDKKAEAEVKTKETELKKLSSRSTYMANGHACHQCIDPQSESTSPDDGDQSEACFKRPSETHLKSAPRNSVAVPDVSCLSEDNGASSISSVDSRSKQSSSLVSKLISSSVLRKLEDNDCMDRDSLMAIAPATVATVADEETRLEVAKDHPSARSCPCEWFVCDEQSTHTRMLIIQGSESLASWQANLFFEPTAFEGLNVFVHRGIYEAAKALYDQVLPEVFDHLSTHGDLARVRFTGHSLGGSLAALLALMFQLRGVLPRIAVLPVVTFGSPFILCGGDYLLRKMQMPQNHIQSVIMHRDVVPRAFACDYPDHVAEVLKRLNGRFRDHPCLNNQKLLYSPMGELYILQPDASAAPSHPLLPDGDGLYALRHRSSEDDVENAIELRGAQRAFLNMPHPLDILADPGAYGFDGTVSRDHDPRNYYKAICVVLKHRVRRLRHIQREQRRQLLWPSVMRGSPMSLTDMPLVVPR